MTRVSPFPTFIRDLSAKRLLTMGWLDGRPLLDFRDHEMDVRNAIAETMFAAWWTPFSRFGVIHGDPHLGNYTARCGRISGSTCSTMAASASFRRFRRRRRRAYRALKRVTATARRRPMKTVPRRPRPRLIDTLNVWARFIYAPMLDDRVRSVADGVRPGEYGRKEAFAVHKRLRELGPVTPPREFVFMDRAAIGLGAVFLHLGAELNFHRLFNEAIAAFDTAALDKRQSAALKKAGVPLAA